MRALRVAAARRQPGADHLQLHRRRDEADVAALLHEAPDPPVVVVLLLQTNCAYVSVVVGFQAIKWSSESFDVRTMSNAMISP